MLLTPVHLALCKEYNTKLFTGGTAEKQIRRFCRLLQDCAEKRAP